MGRTTEYRRRSIRRDEVDHSASSNTPSSKPTDTRRHSCNINLFNFLSHLTLYNVPIYGCLEVQLFLTRSLFFHDAKVTPSTAHFRQQREPATTRIEISYGMRIHMNLNYVPVTTNVTVIKGALHGANRQGRPKHTNRQARRQSSAYHRAQLDRP
jgi:hypothetical protein